MNKRLIFIHSLFRTGSTYLWNKFRKSSKYYCYYEPYHQSLTLLSIDRPFYWDFDKESTDKVRHPPLNKNYLFEYRKLLRRDRKGVPFFKKSFSFDEFCRTDNNPDAKQYIDLLINETSIQTPVLKFNRTALRAKWFKKNYPDSLNIYLVRSPRNQWQSYLSMFIENKLDIFLIMDLMIAGLNTNTAHFRDLATHIPLISYHAEKFNEEEMIYRHLLKAYTDEEKYYIFYYIWLRSFLENVLCSDVIINIDRLSSDGLYRQKTEDFLRVHQIEEMNFRDAKIKKYRNYSIDISNKKGIEGEVQEVIFNSINSKIRKRIVSNLSREDAESLRLDKDKILLLKRKKAKSEKIKENVIVQKYKSIIDIFADGIIAQNSSIENANQRIIVMDKRLVELSMDRDTAIQGIKERDAKLVELSKDRDLAVKEIRKRDKRLTELSKNCDLAIHEINERDAKLTEIHKDRDTAVQEIKKRDKELIELSKDRNLAVKEIRERDKRLAELSKNCDLAIHEINKRDGIINKLTVLNEKALIALPLVSIVTPVLNCEKWIKQCIESVLNQDYPQIEHIIVDGGSTDSTLDICQRYPHLIIHSKKDRGQSHAINKGFDMAQGEILAWLCADDEYEDGAVLAATKAIRSGHDVVMGLSRFIDADGRLIAEHPANVHPYYDYSMLLRFWKYNPISQPATFWTRKVWETCGPIRESIYFAMDYDFWLRVSQRSRFFRIDTHVSKYRIHPEAKCFADNYGSRIELIKVSKQYWPSRLKPGFWKLYFSYILTRSPITKHFADGEDLLKKIVKRLDSSKRWSALFLFIKAHLKHFALPFLPDYRLILKRILKEGIGPAWFWNLGKKIWAFFRKRNK